ncbi:hypothetical protein ACIBKX_33980 [Streptomyces sp. NPDC050658]|uniref:hypothetical protein n=1 Tax=unclassified Streptomyces TaxID=2593676 RepID=UPI003449962B
MRGDHVSAEVGQHHVRLRVRETYAGRENGVGPQLQEARLPELVPLYAPTPNSYKRFAHQSFTPTRFNWGYDNRSCAVRVVDHGDGLHLEIRLPGADANPYLALVAVLAAARDGICRSLTPPPACGGNAYEHGTGRAVPTTLDDALAAFRDGALPESLGPGVADHYTRLAQIELDHHRRTVTDAERSRWFAQA